MTPPREPFFKPGHFFTYSPRMDAHEAASIANRLVEPLLEKLKWLEAFKDSFGGLRDENERLRADVKKLSDIYLCDEEGNEYIQVAMLKEKIRELRSDLQLATKESLEARAELAALKAEIEQAPVVYGVENAIEPTWLRVSFETAVYRKCTHKARLMRIEEIKK